MEQSRWDGEIHEGCSRWPAPLARSLLHHQHPQCVNEGGSLALRRAVEVCRRIRQICLCSGMEEIEEPPPETHVLETRNSSGGREAGCNIFPPLQQATLSCFSRSDTLFSYLTFSCEHLPCFGNVCFKQSTKTLVHMFSSAQERGQGKEGECHQSDPSHIALCIAGRHSGNVARRKIEKAWLEKSWLYFCGICNTVSLLLLPCIADLAGHHFFGSRGKWWKDREALASGITTQGTWD